MYLEFIEMIVHVVHIDMYQCCRLGNRIYCTGMSNWASSRTTAILMCYRGHGQVADAESGGEINEKLGIEH